MAARGRGETDVLLGRAQRVRKRLHEGCPEGWGAIASPCYPAPLVRLR